MYKMVVSSYEEKINHLIAENNDLKYSLRSLQTELDTVLPSAAHVGQTSHTTNVSYCFSGKLCARAIALAI